jgi:hypothetical protein
MEWKEVSSGLPETTRPVLVFSNDIVSSWVDIVNAYVCPEYGGVIWENLHDGEDYAPVVTHWAELPDKPTTNV